MKYKITIERTAPIMTNIGGEWKCLNDDQRTQKMVEEDRHGIYTPDELRERDRTEQVFEQVVEGLDLKNVIAAINGFAYSSK